MFITKDDYKMVIGENALKVLSQIDPDNLNMAADEAVEEVSSYLRPTYNVDKIFAATAGERNRLLVMYTCDVALYHLSASVPQKMGSEIREERYKRAIEWLEGVQAGKIVPNLPKATDTETGEDAYNGLQWHSDRKLRNNW